MKQKRNKSKQSFEHIQAIVGNFFLSISFCILREKSSKKTILIRVNIIKWKYIPQFEIFRYIYIQCIKHPELDWFGLMSSQVPAFYYYFILERYHNASVLYTYIVLHGVHHNLNTISFIHTEIKSKLTYKKKHWKYKKTSRDLPFCYGFNGCKMDEFILSIYTVFCVSVLESTIWYMVWKKKEYKKIKLRTDDT